MTKEVIDGILWLKCDVHGCEKTIRNEDFGKEGFTYELSDREESHVCRECQKKIEDSVYGEERQG